MPRESQEQLFLEMQHSLLAAIAPLPPDPDIENVNLPTLPNDPYTLSESPPSSAPSPSPSQEWDAAVQVPERGPGGNGDEENSNEGVDGEQVEHQSQNASDTIEEDTGNGTAATRNLAEEPLFMLLLELVRPWATSPIATWREGKEARRGFAEDLDQCKDQAHNMEARNYIPFYIGFTCFGFFGYTGHLWIRRTDLNEAILANLDEKKTMFLQFFRRRGRRVTAGPTQTQPGSVANSFAIINFGDASGDENAFYTANTIADEADNKSTTTKQVLALVDDLGDDLWTEELAHLAEMPSFEGESLFHLSREWAQKLVHETTRITRPDVFQKCYIEGPHVVGLSRGELKRAFGLRPDDPDKWGFLSDMRNTTYHPYWGPFSSASGLDWYLSKIEQEFFGSAEAYASDEDLSQRQLLCKRKIRSLRHRIRDLHREGLLELTRVAEESRAIGKEVIVTPAFFYDDDGEEQHFVKRVIEDGCYDEENGPTWAGHYDRLLNRVLDSPEACRHPLFEGAVWIAQTYVRPRQLAKEEPERKRIEEQIRLGEQYRLEQEIIREEERRQEEQRLEQARLEEDERCRRYPLRRTFKKAQMRFSQGLEAVRHPQQLVPVNLTRRAVFAGMSVQALVYLLIALSSMLTAVASFLVKMMRV